MRQPSGLKGGLTSEQILIVMAALLLMFLTYMTIQTETMRYRQLEMKRGRGSVEEWSASLPATQWASASGSKPLELRLFPSRQQDSGNGVHDATDKANGGGHARSMAPVAISASVPDYLAFIGVFSSITGAGLQRRDTLRKSWFPSTKSALEDFETKHSVKLRFVIGKTKSEEVVLGALLADESWFPRPETRK
jgi:hypothetical protein